MSGPRFRAARSTGVSITFDAAGHHPPNLSWQEFKRHDLSRKSSSQVQYSKRVKTGHVWPVVRWRRPSEPSRHEKTLDHSQNPDKISLASSLSCQRFCQARAVETIDELAGRTMTLCSLSGTTKQTTTPPIISAGLLFDFRGVKLPALRWAGYSLAK
jgi:hypothetical protein